MRNILGSKRELVFVGAIVVVLTILFTPIPSGLLDVLLILNLSFALGILTLTIYTDKPTSFSTFPSILLLATLFRLSLNIAATRLILDGADAGEVIESIGSYVVGGNFVIGLVVFLILIVVQFVVVTNGAQRIAEVAARFTLDSMPGKQMSIDADLNMGIIDHHEAIKRRKDVEKEASFYGAMDGASKFVKGDAIAGILIVMIDIIGGLAIGISQMGMSWSEALHRYTLLTVGDGIVTQIPALVISVATGIIVTRAASDGELGKEIFDQVGKHPRSVILILFALLPLLILPSMPVLPIALVMLLLIVGLVFLLRQQKVPSAEEEGVDLYEYSASSKLALQLSPDLCQQLGGEDWLQTKVNEVRMDVAERLGVVIPNIEVLLTGKGDQYQITRYGATLAAAELRPGKVLAISSTSERVALDGENTQDPAYGLPACWIDESQVADAKRYGYTLVSFETVLVTHLSDLVRKNIGEFIDRAFVESLLARARETSAPLVEEVVPTLVSVNGLIKILRLMAEEGVPLRSFEQLLAYLSEAEQKEAEASQLYEIIRRRMASTLVEGAVVNGNLKVVALAGDIESALISAVTSGKGLHAAFTSHAGIESFVRKSVSALETLLTSGRRPVLIAAPVVRRQLRDYLSDAFPSVVVISTLEIPKGISIDANQVIGS